MQVNAILINSKDNVVTLVVDVQQNDNVVYVMGNEIYGIQAKEFIKRGHKIAIKDIAKGEKVMKYGYLIGLASKAIAKGYHVHVHNVESTKGRGDLNV